MSRVETIAEGVTLYLGDCREIMPTLGRVDAVVTDPPYGKRERTARKTAGRGFNRHDLGKNVGSKDWRPVIGDDEPFDPSHLLDFPKVVLFGANYFSSKLPDRACWLVWDKRENSGSDDNADCELAWTNLKSPARVHRQLWRGICRRGEENIVNGFGRVHPTQKSIAVMSFALEVIKLSAKSLVLDPYMGSGTTGVAAVRAGHQFTGIELDPEYFDVACRRIADEASRPTMFRDFPAPAKQEAFEL
jgi:site-specific DNA-methyltransferase (adenine-specific)